MNLKLPHGGFVLFQVYIRCNYDCIFYTVLVTFHCLISEILQFCLLQVLGIHHMMVRLYW